MKQTSLNKSTKIKITIGTLLSCLSILSSCGQGNLRSVSAEDLNHTNDGLGTTNPDQPNTLPAIEQVDLKARVDDSKNKLGFNDALAFDFDKKRGEFIIMVPMPSGFVFTPSGTFNKYPDISFGPLFDATGKMKVAIRVPVKYVLKGVNTIPSASLPNGDPLPAMPAGQGELPSLALSFPQQDNTQVHLYIGINALGLFVTLPNKAALPIPVNITLPLKNKDKTKTFGYLTYVNAKNGYPPGLFIATGVPANVARILEDHFGL